MKLTKARLKRIIKEEIEGERGPVQDLEGRTFDFVINRTEFLSGRSKGPRLYVINVPYEMLDTSKYEELKVSNDYGAQPAEQFLKLKPEFLKQLGFQSGRLAPHAGSKWLEKGVPESVEIRANYNPHTGELTSASPLPKIIDASTL